MPKSFPFFAAGSDLRSLLSEVDSQFPVQYVVGGMSSKQRPEVFSSSLLLPNLGSATMGDQSKEPFYLVMPSSIEVTARPVQQNKGGTMFSFDQLENAPSVVLRPGGVFQTTCIIAGQVGTTLQDDVSKNLMTCFSKLLRKRFHKLKSYYVGEEAILLMETGMRLTTSMNAPVEYDLKKD